MTTERRLERDLPSILDELAMGPYPDYIDDVLATTAQRRQRPAWTFPERWLPMDIATQRIQAPGVPWRAVGVLALIALLVAAALAVYIGSQPRLPAPFGLARNGLIPYTIDGDIFAGDPATGLSEPLLAGPTFDFEPGYSRDGTRIAFLRRVDPEVEGLDVLMVMDADGTNVKPVTSEPFRLIEWWDWAPNGDALVMVHEPRGARVFQLFDPDGIEAPRTLAKGIQVEAPVFRPPDSTEILFRGETADGVRLYVMNADGSDIRPLTEPPVTGNTAVHELRHPRYSPDGSLIAFNLWDAAAGVTRFYVMNADGTHRREMGADPDIHYIAMPVWSNDGTRIAVQIAASEENVASFAVIDVRTDELVKTGPVLTENNGGAIEWAPDDSTLLMVPNEAGARQLLLDPAGGPWTQAPWDSDSYPNWQRKAP